jgi:predicted MPP superfamily phosphohydrolase
VEYGGSSIALAGTSSPWGVRPSMTEAPEADYKILLSHAPDLYYWAERRGFNLMLSGHNHGGQIRLPLVGPVFMPSRYSRRFDRGFFRRHGLTLHVSQGIAGKHPIRYGCLPEIGRLVLRSAQTVERETPSRAKLRSERTVSEGSIFWLPPAMSC